MVEGRDGVVVTMAVLGLLMVLLHCEVACTTYSVVGDSKGWVKGVAGWEKGKKFYFGNGLAFNYPKGQHNVVVVNKAGYDACKAAPGDKVYSSGNDTISFVKGENYFICTFPGHCPTMKIHVTALSITKVK